MRCIWKTPAPVPDRRRNSFADSYWRVVNLPHDWAVELPFDWAADGSHGFKTLGAKYPTNSIAWYRRTFELPASEDEGKRIWLTFDGVFRDATVWVNGWCVRHHEGGYYPFREDITDVVHFGGKNTIAVRVDATEIRGLVLRRRGHLPPRLAGQDRAGGHRAGRDFCLFVEFKNNVPSDKAEITRRSQSAQHAHQRREGGGELRNHFAGRQIAEAIFNESEKLKRESQGAVKLEIESFLAGSLVAGIAKTLQAHHDRFR